MTDDWRAIEALKTLKARYFLCLDSKDWEGWRELFTDDAEMDLSAQFPDSPDPSIHILRGGETIVRTVAAALGETVSVHHGHNPIITIEDANNASGIWALEDNLFRPDGTRFTGFGHYHERYRMRDGVWRIAQTRLTRIRMFSR